MRSNRRGFSLIETAVVLVIGTALVSVAAPSLNGARDRLSVSGARTTFGSLQARARGQAIERGTTVTMVVDAVGDSVSLWVGAELLETFRFGKEHIDIRAPENILRLCMTSRGYADPQCNSFTTAPTITFWQNTELSSVTILPMGQLVF